MHERALVKILHPLNSQERLEARVVEWSDPYVTLRLPQRLMPATVVQIRFGGRIAMGEVRRCDPAHDEFEIQIQFQDVLSVGETS